MHGVPNICNNEKRFQARDGSGNAAWFGHENLNHWGWGCTFGEGAWVRRNTPETALPANVGFGNFNVGFGNFQALGFGNSPLPGFGNSPPPGFGNCNVRFGNFQALGFGNFVVTARIRKLLRTLIRKLLGPNLKKPRRVPGKLEEHPASDVVALPEPNSFEFIRIKARLPGRNRQRIFQKQ